MSKFSKIILSMIMFSAHPSAASELCQKEFGRLVYELESYVSAEDTSKAQQKRLLAEYHGRKQMLPSLCEKHQIDRIEAAAQKAFAGTNKARSISALQYSPRKTVDIGIVDNYEIFKNK